MDQGDPLQYHQEGATLVNPLLDQEHHRCFIRLEEENMCPMLAEIEHKPFPRWPAVMHCPKYLHSAQLVETVAGID